MQMQTISTTRLDNNIVVYRDRVIIPRKVAVTYTDEATGNSKTNVVYTATIFDDEDPQDGFHASLEEFKTLEGTLRIAKLTIDLSIERFKEWCDG